MLPFSLIHKYSLTPLLLVYSLPFELNAEVLFQLPMQKLERVLTVRKNWIKPQLFLIPSQAETTGKKSENKEKQPPMTHLNRKNKPVRELSANTLRPVWQHKLPARERPTGR